MNNKPFKNYSDLKQTIRKRFKFFKYSIIGLTGMLVLLASMFLISDNKTEIDKPSEDYTKIKQELETINSEIEKMNKIEDSLHQIASNSQTDINKIKRNTSKKDYDDYRNHSQTIINLIENIESRIDEKSEYYNEIINSVNNKKEILDAMPSIMPISPDECLIGSGYGIRLHPINKIYKKHEGIDFVSITGTMIRATADGEVIESEIKTGFGLMVKIKHGKGYETIYAHLSSTLVSVGDKVQKGDVIAQVGSTGLSSGPHLHYEVIKNGSNVDPINYFYSDLTPKEYDEMIAICNNSEMSLD